MRYPEAETAEKHQRIVEAAAALFRARGLSGVSVSEVMKAAGLTHGAFYNHFASKDALIAEAIAETTKQFLDGLAAVSADRAGLEAYVTTYLSRAHLDAPGKGCVMAALATEIAHDPAAKPSFTKHFNILLTAFLSRFPGKSAAATRKDSIQTVSTMVGAMVLARATDDPALAEEILATVKHGLTTAN
ncbi:TetR family transcriptional regulator [Cypionkella aquatica]|uniref:TetR family transcriptional regulator n=1 Tax=Cypionkella aquatica TaxID=1756042 RepID=A0AA37U3R0_9RHOB|nr:TetR/AcrR family transcriptional regulator [Cypionkella aquatica]GLS85481.1 TetR family transcriptional regulator [Cypionkella aquatica]